jgi:hypothetical protein
MAMSLGYSKVFVFTKPGTEAGETLSAIVNRKEEERAAGKNVFWWGLGSSLGDDLLAVGSKVGEIPIIINAHNRSPQVKSENANPTRIVRWTKWKSAHGAEQDVPPFAKVTSRWDEKKRLHYALVCSSETELAVDPHGSRFDIKLCKTFRKGRIPGTSQVTALVEGDLSDLRHREGDYRILFRADLVVPWQAKLTRYI